MRRLLADAARTFVPRRGDPQGPLPPLMLALTLVTGVVDAVSFLTLGHVFVANMTGNVIFLGFALAGAEDLSALASVVAMASFLTGAVVGGRVGARYATHRGRLLRAATIAQSVLVTAALVVTAVADGEVTTRVRYPLIVLLALAMGLQNATALRLSVPDMTTTVMTRTLAGLAADSTPGGGAAAHPGRRLLSVLAVLLGALIGAAFLVRDQPVAPLVLVLALLAGTSVTVHRLSTPEAAWVVNTEC
ncbi:putative membrane protein [Streptomyces davaonensis JCM 4913]|uniref:Putative membrane protein n=1 Tax=Streptomyces davaonensis (strain DSM 101723 / JCM 4913 / KCC S-0913 / 768) TaxID=1214101 RepID=K4REF8_STRDJ|nr:YoaK family protein [Streptomyces davaonensis]CCK31947.1 putative membrane protein [Streptomyces davaonensis JCM 4913]